MSILPKGWVSLAKTGEDPDGTERFTTAVIDPSKVDLPGYIWTTMDGQTEAQVREGLRTAGMPLAGVDDALSDARAQWAATLRLSQE